MNHVSKRLVKGNLIYEEISSNKEKIGVAITLEMVNDDVEFYKEIGYLQKLLQNFNIGALSIDQKDYLCEQSSKLKKWMVATRQPTSSIPCVGINIETQQRNVTWIKLGFNVPRTKHIPNIGEFSTTRRYLHN